MRNLLFLTLLLAFACNKDSESDKIAVIVNADLEAFKAGTLGATLKQTASGLKYIIHEQGTGAAVKNGDYVATHYYGALQSNGKMFDNSYDNGDPAYFQVGTLISGFNEGMKLINTGGGKITLFIPSALGYGANGAGSDIPPNADLVFYVELP